jgi:hypothetical protein
MTAERARASRPDNLFEPVAGDHGAHGRFGRRSRSAVTAASARTVRGAAVAVGIGLVVAAGIAGAAFASGRPPRKRIAHRRGRSAELRDD